MILSIYLIYTFRKSYDGPCIIFDIDTYTMNNTLTLSVPTETNRL